ncbi:hypothetical protein N9Y75_04030 [Candidatus Poseidoniales archaeon]|nr:hypothetical protein [Candidatus Poseidoniales archaeon]MDB2672001.1 hypothetical protein [Candidatus Poseidoniales archaeon]
MAERWVLDLQGKRIHLSVDGGCGGTTLGLHCAVDEIQGGGRVLWASPDMPNATRFSQLFTSLNIVEASRFHAMNLIGNMERCVDAIVEAEQHLPSVGLIVLDDWCEPTGRIPSRHIKAMIDLKKRIDDSTTLLLISKAGTDVSSNDTGAIPRSETILIGGGFEIWTLQETEHKSKILVCDGTELAGKIEDSGFIF